MRNSVKSSSCVDHPNQTERWSEPQFEIKDIASNSFTRQKSNDEAMGPCERAQPGMSPMIAKLLWNVSDRSRSAHGGERVVELIRRLVYLRDYRSVNQNICS